jgi:hypothetical protein
MSDIPDFSKVPLVESPKEDSIPDFSAVPLVSEQKPASSKPKTDKKSLLEVGKKIAEPVVGVAEFGIGSILDIPQGLVAAGERLGAGTASFLSGKGYATGSAAAEKARPLSKYIPSYELKTETAKKIGEVFEKGVDTVADLASTTFRMALGQRVPSKALGESDNVKAFVSDAIGAGMSVAAAKGVLSIRAKVPKKSSAQELKSSGQETGIYPIRGHEEIPVVMIKDHYDPTAIPPRPIYGPLPNGKVLEVAPFDPKGKLSPESYEANVKAALAITENAFRREQGIELKKDPLHGNYVNAMKQLGLSRAYADLEAQKAKEPGLKPAFDDKLWKNKEHEILDEHLDNLLENSFLPMWGKTHTSDIVKGLEDAGIGKETILSILPENASWESAASQEAINRFASQVAKGEDWYVLDQGTGQVTPLVTVDRVDRRARGSEIIIKRKGAGSNEFEIIDTGPDVMTNWIEGAINRWAPKVDPKALGGVGKKGFGQGGAVDPRVLAEALAKAGRSAEEIVDYLNKEYGDAIRNIAPAIASRALSNQKDVTEGIKNLSSNLPTNSKSTSVFGGFEVFEDTPIKVLNSENITNEFYKLANKSILDKLTILDTLKKIPKDELEILSSEDFYHALEADQANLTPTQRALRDKYITPLREELVRIYNKLKDANLDPDVDASTYVPRIVPKYNKLFDPDNPIASGIRQGTTSLGAKPGPLKSRKMMALVDEQGNRKIVEIDGRKIFAFDEQGKPFLVVETDRVPKKGQEIGGFRLEDATTKEIEANTPVRYNKNALVNFLYSVERMRRAERELDFLNTLKSSPEWRTIAVPFGEGIPPLGWAEAENPALRGWYIEPRIREALDDFAGKGPSDVVAFLEGVNRIIVGSLFINPVPHLLNITDHWFTQRGLTGWVTPWGLKRLIDTAPIAAKEVLTQGPLYREFLANGASLQWARVLTQDFYQKLLPQLEKDPGFVEIAKAVGKSPAKLVRSLYRGASHIMWALSDVMQMQAYLEKKAKLQSQGRYESLGQVFSETDKHMPNYRVAPRIAEKELSRVLGNKAGSIVSRGASIVMRAPLINTFGRYKYGRAASLVHMAKDLIKGDMKTKAEALDKIAALAVAVYLVYPLLSKITSYLTGENIEAEKFGGSKVLQTFYDFANGDKDYDRVLSLFWQMPPLTKAGVELASNRELFTGKPVIYPGQDIEGKGIDLLEYIMKNVPVFQMGAAPTYFAKDPEEFLLQQLGMRKVETEERKKAIAKKMKQRQLRQHLMQRRKRENKRQER